MNASKMTESSIRFQRMIFSFIQKLIAVPSLNG